MEITDEMSRQACENAIEVFNGSMSIGDAVSDLVKELGMNHGSANNLITNFQHMMAGKRYTWTMNIETTNLFIESIKARFGMEAMGKAVDALGLHLDHYKGSQPKLRELFESLNLRVSAGNLYPDEIVHLESYKEGAKKQVIVNAYERNRNARSKCIELHGCACAVCGLDFQTRYGDLGKGFIHVHHVVELASIAEEYEIDPENDLMPVCPNCHAMLHRKKPALSIRELTRIIHGGS